MTVTAPPTTATAPSTELGGRVRDGRLDPEVVRRDFPILATESHGHSNRCTITSVGAAARTSGAADGDDVVTTVAVIAATAATAARA